MSDEIYKLLGVREEGGAGIAAGRGKGAGGTREIEPSW